MEKLHYSIFINAPREKVWHAMLDDATYREWTFIFNPAAASYFEGDWSQGSEMKFLGPEPDGTTSGMYSEVAENRENEFMSLKHLGEIHKGEKQPWPTDMGDGFFENYTLNEKDGGTEVLIDLDSNDEFKAMFESTWPKALEKLKEISER